MPKLLPAEYVAEARRLACQKDAKAQRVAKKFRRSQKVLGDVPETIALLQKFRGLEQEAAVLRWLATRVELTEK